MDKKFKIELLSGGIEERFIPTLSDETKRQIEGSFKIVEDQKLRELSLASADSVQLTDEDKLLSFIIDGKRGESDAADLAIESLNVL